MPRAVHHVLGVRMLSPDAFVVRVERHGLAFAAGQHVTLGLHGAGINREYSVYSAPGDPDLEFLIRVHTGSNSAALLRDSPPGTPLDLAGPYGAFGVGAGQPPPGPHLLVATGAGIAPFHSLVRAHPGLDYILVHGVRTLADAYDRDHYAPDRYIPCASRQGGPGAFDGRVGDWLDRHSPAPGCRVLLCGHASMVADVYDRLRARGVPSDNLLTEVFF